MVCAMLYKVNGNTVDIVANWGVEAVVTVSLRYAKALERRLKLKDRLDADWSRATECPGTKE